jgi:hypothetical protein
MMPFKTTTTKICFLFLSFFLCRIDSEVNPLFRNLYHEKDGSDELPTNSPVDSWAETSHGFDILTEAIDPCFSFPTTNIVSEL